MVREQVGILAAAGLLALCGAAGAQDYGIANAHSPEEGVLFGGQPDSEQLAELVNAGFRSVIDLRGEDEDRGFDEPTMVRLSGLAYLPLPITQETLGAAATFDRFLEMFETAEKPVLVHCRSGNRVGALYYAYLVAKKGVPRDEALAVAKANGLRSLALVEPVNQYLDR